MGCFVEFDCNFKNRIKNIKIYDPIEEDIKKLNDKEYIISFNYNYNKTIRKFTYSISGKKFWYAGVLPPNEMIQFIKELGNPPSESNLTFGRKDFKVFLKRIGYYICYYGT